MKANEPIFSTWATAIIAIGLIIPFLIRAMAPAMEPYPSILLPLGIGMGNTESELTEVQSTQIKAQLKNGMWERIEPVRFMEPMPSYYLYSVASSNLGLVSQNHKEINTTLWGRVSVPRNSITDEDIEETRKWIRDRLKKLGYSNSVIRLEQSVKVVNIHTDSVQSETILEVKDFELD